MIPLYMQEQFDVSKVTDKFPCQCEICSNIFYKSKRDILKVLNGERTENIVLRYVKVLVEEQKKK